MDPCEMKRASVDARVFDWRTHCRPAMERQSHWALVAECENYSVAVYCKYQCQRQLKREGRWQVTARKRPANGRYGLYCRYLGPVDPTSG